jgi:hypothetical protein
MILYRPVIYSPRLRYAGRPSLLRKEGEEKRFLPLSPTILRTVLNSDALCMAAVGDNTNKCETVNRFWMMIYMRRDFLETTKKE